MKIKYVLLASSLMLSAASFAQKDELKTLKKLYTKGQLTAENISEYKSAVNSVSAMSGLAEQDLVYVNFYKSMLPILELNNAFAKNPNNLQSFAKSFSPENVNPMVNGLKAVLDFEKKSGKEIYTKEINETMMSVKPKLVDIAYSLNDSKLLVQSAKAFESAYLFDKNDPINLYNASILAMQAKDYDYALVLLDELIKIKYSGEGTLFFAVNKTSKQEESFPNKQQRDLFVKTGSHEKPREEKVPSKKGDIYKSYVSILIDKGRVEEAKKAIAEARVLNPDDSALIIAEANLYYQTKDYATYKKLIGEALAKTPNDVDLLFNYGAVSSSMGNSKEAKEYFEKVISIDPKNVKAYNNLGALAIEGDDKIVKEMQGLGMTPKESKRYDELKKVRGVMFKNAIPYYEKAMELDPNDESIKSMLLNIYQFLDMDAKYKALKAKK